MGVIMGYQESFIFTKNKADFFSNDLLDIYRLYDSKKIDIETLKKL